MSEAEVDQVARHGFKPGAASDRCWFLPSTPPPPPPRQHWTLSRAVPTALGRTMPLSGLRGYH